MSGTRLISMAVMIMVTITARSVNEAKQVEVTTTRRFTENGQGRTMPHYNHDMAKRVEHPRQRK